LQLNVTKDNSFPNPKPIFSTNPLSNIYIISGLYHIALGGGGLLRVQQSKAKLKLHIPSDFMTAVK